MLFVHTQLRLPASTWIVREKFSYDSLKYAGQYQNSHRAFDRCPRDMGVPLSSCQRSSWSLEVRPATIGIYGCIVIEDQEPLLGREALFQVSNGGQAFGIN